MDAKTIYDLKKFGRSAEKIRIKNKLKKTTIKKLYDINPDTLRKLELGITLPTHDTLNKLSEAYNINMIKVFEACKYANHQALEFIRKIINCAAYEDRIELLEDAIFEIRNIQNIGNISDKIDLEVRQLEILTELVKLKNKTDVLSVENSEILSLKGIRLTKSSFNIKEIDIHVYSLIESRFLLSLGLTQVRKRNFNLAEYIINHVLDNLIFHLEYDKTVAPLLIQAYYQKSNLLFQLQRNNEIIECCTLALDLASQFTSTKLMPYIYFRLGIAQYKLGLPFYRETLMNSLNFLESYGQKKLKSTFENSLLNNYNIKL